MSTASKSLPLVDEQVASTGLITLKDIMKMEQYPKATKDARGRLAVGAAVGVKDRDMERGRKDARGRRRLHRR